MADYQLTQTGSIIDQTLINSRNCYTYVCDPDEVDQGAVGNGNSLKDLIDAIGTSKTVVIDFLHHPQDGNTTTYTLTTSEIVPDNMFLRFQPGAIIRPAAAKTLTIYSPENIVASPRQQIINATDNSTDPLQFTKSGTVFPQWWNGDAGDGSTECAIAVQLAIDSISAHTDFIKTKFLAGDYVISSEIDVEKNVWIQGDGEGSYLNFSGLGVAENAFQFDDSGSSLDDFRISDLRILGPGGDEADAGKGISINSRHHERIRIENLRIERFTYGIYLDGQIRGEGPSIINNWIDRISYAGIRIQDSENALISGNFIDGQRDEAGNEVGDETSAEVGIWQTSEGGGTGDIGNKIIGNTVHNVRGESILVRGKYSTVVGNVVYDGDGASAKGIVVEPFTSDSPTEDDGKLYVTISGNTVYDMPHNGISIQTDYANTTQGSGYVTISNNTIYNCGKETAGIAGISIGSSVDSPMGKHIVVSNNVISDTYYGIAARKTEKLQLIGNIITDTGSTGIRIYEVEGCTIIGGTVDTDADVGIDIKGGQDTLIRSVSVLDLTLYGIKLEDATDMVVVSDCRISDQKDTPTMSIGIVCDSDITGFIHYNNVIEGFTSYAIYNDEIVAAAPALSIWGPSVLSGASNQVDATLADGKEVGDIKTIVLKDATNQPHTVTIAHHVTEDAEVATFDAVDETLVLIWTGTEWATIYATCTF